MAFSVDFEGNVTRYLYDNQATGGGRLVSKKYYAAATLDTASIVITNATTAEQLAQDIANATGLTAERTVSYKFDAFGRTVEVNDNSAVTRNAFDGDGRLTQIDSPQGIINYKYDNLGRLERTWTSKTTSGSDAITDTGYLYDALGRLKTVTVIERNDAL